MKFLPMIWGNLMRRKARTLFTVLSILVAFVLYAFLSAVNLAFSLGVDITGADRLILIHKVSIIQPLPISYEERIAQIEGVTDVAHATWFGGVYQVPKNFFPQMPVEPEAFLRLYPEFVLPDEQREAWLADRTGAIVGRKTAERFGWKIGDRIPIQGTIWRKKDGGSTWEFNLVGIYDGETREVDATQFFFRYDYFDEARAMGEGLVGWYIIRIDDPENAVAIAERIDARFSNSRFETKTSTEKAFVQAFANQVGDIGAILRAVMSAVFFTILLVAGNTMALSVRERTAEMATLKTLGYSNGGVLTLVMAESIVLAAIGGGLGLLLGWMWIRAGDPTGGMLAVFYFPARDIVIGAALVIVLGAITGIIPAVRAMRLSIVDGLRRV